MALTPLTRLQSSNGTWAALKADWAAQCAECGEDFASYGLASFSVLDPLAEAPDRHAAVYALKIGDQHRAVCQLNLARLPAFDDPVLRVRHLMFAPIFDFGDYPIQDYADLLVGFFGGVIAESRQGPLQAKHVHFHLRSPTDRNYFHAVGVQLNAHQPSIFEDVKARGAWLYIVNR